MAVIHYVHVNYDLILGGKPITSGNAHLAVSSPTEANIRTALATLGVSYPGATIAITGIKNMNNGGGITQ